MKASQHIILLSCLVSAMAHAQPPFAMPCRGLDAVNTIDLPEVMLSSAQTLQSERIANDVFGFGGCDVKVPFSKLSGRIGREINFELLLPDRWNGIFVMAGNGGFGGSIQNDLRNYLNDGYAIVATDGGHQGSQLMADWALNNVERQLNYARLAVHRVAAVSKYLVTKYYCAAPRYSYFIGCSRGGGQAMMEAQAYPEDFSGVVAGAPTIAWSAFSAKFIDGCQHFFPDGTGSEKRLLTNENLKLLQNLVLAQCDGLDGLSDRILNDPRICHFDFSKLPACANNKPGPTCFTTEQVNAIKSIYSPLTAGGKQIYPGFPMGLEGEPAAWSIWITGTSDLLPNLPSLHYFLGTGVFKYFVFNDPSWDYNTYDFKNFFRETSFASSLLDASQTDYTAFKKLNGKMIIWHGWSDPGLSAYATINHFEEASKADPDLQSYVRLFLLPGVLHCGSGTGPDRVDWLKLIRDWVEHEVAPERVIVSKVEAGNTVMTRPVYPYPKLAWYVGTGDPNLEMNFKLK